MVLNIITIVMLIALVAVIGVGIAVLGMLPGRIAKGRNHPQAEAINVAGWLGLLTGGILSLFALIWAYIRPNEHPGVANSEEFANLKSKVGDLEDEVRRLGGAQ